MNLTIFKKGLLLVLAPLLVQLISIGLLAQVQQRTLTAQEWSLHSKNVITQAQVLQTQLLEAQAAVRGLLLAKDTGLEASFAGARQAVPAAVEQLTQLVRDNSAQSQRAATIAHSVVTVLAMLTECDRLIRANERAAAVDRLRSGAASMNELQAQLGALLEAEAAVDAQRYQQLGQSWARLKGLLLASGIVAVAVSAVLTLLFSRSIAGRLETLIENAQRLAHGNELLPPLRGTDEIALLDQAFHSAAVDLLRSQSTLRDQARLLQSILNSMSDAVVAADQQRHFLVFNPAAERMFGKPLTAGAPAEWAEQFGLYRPDATTPLPLEAMPLLRAIGGEKVDDVEFFARPPQHERGIWCRASARPLQTADGAILAGVMVAHDITEHKQTEAAIQQLNEELEQRVIDRTMDLAEVNRDLLQKNQENETFVYSVSHDLRSPLVNLQGFSKELQLVGTELRTLLSAEQVPATVRDRASELLDGEMADAIRFIQTAVTRLSNIIDALLRLSRAGRVQFQAQSVDLNAIVQRIITALKGTIAERSAQVTTEPLPAAWGDPTALEQVFANLIGNALHYLDARRPGRVEIGALPMAPDAPRDNGAPLRQVYFVKDNGLGIPAAYRAKVFQAFQRLHPEVAKGEGMGLAIVNRMVERHRGKIWVESEVGVGSTFFVSLPSSAAG